MKSLNIIAFFVFLALQASCTHRASTDIFANTPSPIEVQNQKKNTLKSIETKEEEKSKAKKEEKSEKSLPIHKKKEISKTQKNTSTQNPKNHLKVAQKKTKKKYFSKRKQKTKKKIALILGAGGIKGLAHIGIIEELVKANIPVDLIIGCSSGSLVGSLYSKYNDISKVKDLFLTKSKDDFLEFSLMSSFLGLSNGEKLKDFLEDHLDGDSFESLKTPLKVVATDLVSGSLITFDKGNVLEPILGSAAYPMVFKPVTYEDYMLVDGGVISPLPCEALSEKERKNYFIIAVDLSCELPEFSSSNLFSIAKRSLEISYKKTTERNAKLADVVIKPNIGQIGSFEDGHNNFLYEEGKASAKRALKEINKQLYLIKNS